MVEELFEKYNTPSNVIEHCKAVRDVAVAIGKELNTHGYDLDIGLINGAAYAHDFIRVMPKHDVTGASLLMEYGFVREAAIVLVHMRYPQFSPMDKINETDIVCLADRLVKDDQYVGLDERIDYVIAKINDPAKTPGILRSKNNAQKFIDGVEKICKKSIKEIVNV